MQRISQPCISGLLAAYGRLECCVSNAASEFYLGHEIAGGNNLPALQTVPTKRWAIAQLIAGS